VKSVENYPNPQGRKVSGGTHVIDRLGLYKNTHG